jgi:ribulose-5-phosphate 4-epimerase/fuculose-1-phosphate aldolase
MLLGNHGIVALGSTVAEVEAVTAMAVKAARVRTVALATGRPMVSLEAHHAEALSRRPDEVARRETLGKARQ